MSNFGDWVNAMRCQRQWSQRQLALKAGISNTEIARIEQSERRSPSVDTVVKIANAFKISVVDLLADAKFITVEHLAGYVKLTADESSLIAAYRRLDERGKNAVVDTARRELRYVTA